MTVALGAPVSVRVPSERVVSVGIDCADVSDVRRSLDRFGAHYLDKVYTTREVLESRGWKDPAPRLALCFAAKEAVIKALTVEGAQPPWTCMEVRHHPAGWAEMHLSGEAARLASKRGIGRMALSLSLEGDVAGAIVVGTAARWAALRLGLAIAALHGIRYQWTRRVGSVR